MEIGQELWKSEKQGFGEGKNEGGLLIVPVFCFDVPLLSSPLSIYYFFGFFLLYYTIQSSNFFYLLYISQYSIRGFE